MGRSARKTAILLAVFTTYCSRTQGPEVLYRHAWATYLSGDLPRAVEEASRNAARWRKEPSSPWYWNFRLLEAEALTAQSRMKEAGALLKDPAPSRPEWSQVEARRLIDQAQLAGKDEAARILELARPAITDPVLLIRFKLIEGILAFRQGRIDASQIAFRGALEIAVN